MMIDMTAAKIGRSTKKWENRMGALAWSVVGLLRPCRCVDGLDGAVLRLDLLPRPRALQPIDHDAVARGEAGSDHTQAVDDRPELDQLDADHAVVRDRKHDLARLVRRDGAVRHQQRVMGA